MSALQLSLGMEEPVTVGRVTTSSDPTLAAIDFIAASITSMRPRQGTSRARLSNAARPVAYLYARQNDVDDERLSITRQWLDLRYIEARAGDADIEADWLRVTGERSTRRTETYGDTRARWKVADHWTRNRTTAPSSAKPWRWVLDLRVSTNGRDDVRAAMLEVRRRMELVCTALSWRECTYRTNAMLATHIAPIVLAACWDDWMSTAIGLACDVDPASEDWVVHADQLGDQGHPHHEAIARLTVEPNTADATIIQSLRWAHDVAV